MEECNALKDKIEELIKLWCYCANPSPRDEIPVGWQDHYNRTR